MSQTLTSPKSEQTTQKQSGQTGQTIQSEQTEQTTQKQSGQTEQTTQKQSGQTENNNIFFLILNIGFIIILCILTIVNIVYYFIKNISKDRNQLDFLVKFNPIELVLDPDTDNTTIMKPVPKQNNFELGNNPVVTSNYDYSLVFNFDNENSTLKEGGFYTTGVLLNNLSMTQEIYNSGIENGTPIELYRDTYIKNNNGEFTDISYYIELIKINSSLYGSIIGAPLSM